VRIPLAVLLGTGLGAIGGAAVAPKGGTTSGALSGAFWGGISGGVGSAAAKGLVTRAYKRGKFIPTFTKALATTPMKEPIVGAGIVTGTTAAINKLTGAYEPEKRNKNRLIRAVAPGADDLAMLGYTIMKGMRV
jgi:hypothetical protein